jgi:hypothetical protein
MPDQGALIGHVPLFFPDLLELFFSLASKAPAQLDTAQM